MDKQSSGASAARSSFSLSQQDINIKPEDLQNPLGRGGFGVVYKGSHQLAPAAIKELLVEDLSPHQLAEFIQEAEIMANLHHPNIIQLYGYTDIKPYRIVMQFMPKGSLFKVLHSDKEVSWTQKITWGMEIGAGLHYLHTRKPQIIHRDLKSLNVLISKDNEAKLTDFGLALAKLRTTTSTLTSSAKARKAEEPTGAVGSTRWMAPELFADLDPTYNPATDMFAYAIVLWELAAQEIPYPNVRADSVIENAVQQGKRAALQPDWPEGFKSLIARCWDQTPKQRPSAAQAVEALADSLTEAEALSQATHSLSVAVPASRGYALSSDTPAPAKAMAAEPKPQPAAFFAPKAPAKSAVDQAAVEKLLHHVARGEQDEAEALLKIKGNEALLLHKGTVTDYSNRTFKNITVFQYALWALDWHMWKMLLKYLPQDEAKIQLQDLESNGTDHDTHYDFTPLIVSLKTYIDKFGSWNQKQAENHWIKAIGYAQTKVPAHVANEYCQEPFRPFDPVPSFTEDQLLRTFDICDDIKFYPITRYSSGILYSDFAICRGILPHARQRACEFSNYVDGHYITKLVAADFLAIKTLCEVRMGQYQELKLELMEKLTAQSRKCLIM